MKKVVLGIGLAVLSALNVSATTAVDLWWSTTNGNASARTPDSFTALSSTWNFSDTTKLITSTKGTNATVYGGMAATWTTAQTNNYTPLLQWSVDVPGFKVRVNPDIPATATATKGILLWKKADFLNGMNTNTVGFISGNSLTADVGVTGSAELRFVVNQGGAYYVSDTNSTVAGVFTIDPTTTLWRTLSTDNSYTIGTTAVTLTLNDIQAVGIYMSGARTGAPVTTMVTVKSFKANVTVVPWSVSIMLLGLGTTDTPYRHI